MKGVEKGSLKQFFLGKRDQTSVVVKGEAIFVKSFGRGRRRRYTKARDKGNGEGEIHKKEDQRRGRFEILADKNLFFNEHPSHNGDSETLKAEGRWGNEC